MDVKIKRGIFGKYQDIGIGGELSTVIKSLRIVLVASLPVPLVVRQFFNNHYIHYSGVNIMIMFLTKCGC